MSGDGRGLSLYEIESELVQLIEAREAAADCLQVALTEDDRKQLQAELDAADEAIQLYLHEEVRKVDGIIRYVVSQESAATAAKLEAERLKRVAEVRENRARRVKDMVLGIMQGMGYKRLEGTLGALLCKKNGGVQALNIVDEAAIDASFRVVRITMRLRDWERVQFFAAELWEDPDPYRRPMMVTQLDIDGQEIRKALAAGPVEGAELKPRGVHLEIR